MQKTNTKFGIYNFGIIKTGGIFIDILNDLIKDTSQLAEYNKFNKHFYNQVIVNGNIKYLNKYGYSQNRQGTTYLQILADKINGQNN